MRGVQPGDLSFGVEWKAGKHTRLPQRQKATLPQRIGVRKVSWIKKEENIAEEKNGLAKRGLPKVNERRERQRDDGKNVDLVIARSDPERA
jgi:hypothetical protein